MIIGKRMRQICDARGVEVDIEWEDDKRLYGEKWYEFIADCRAMLGTESGSNIFDDYGEIRKNVENILERDPEVTYEQVYDMFLADHEGAVRMNQVSPKIFEAIALRTALVLFDGEYSGVINSHIHYIPLKKDFSNVDEVLEKLRNVRYLEELADRAYQDIIRSGEYSYRRFIQLFDEYVRKKVKRGGKYTLLTALVGSKTIEPISLMQLAMTVPSYNALYEAYRSDSVVNNNSISKSKSIALLFREYYYHVFSCCVSLLRKLAPRTYNAARTIYRKYK